nr:transposase [uncultured Capnocytophaga sp.]
MNNYYYNPDIHHRRSIRLQGYDYAQKGMYFITLCVQERECIFGTIFENRMFLNEIGQIVTDEWVNTMNIRDNVIIHDFIVMPNHIHGIVEITYNKNDECLIGEFVSPTKSIGAIVRGFKIATTKRIKNFITPVGANGNSPLNSNSPFNSNSFQQEWIINHLPHIWQRNYYEHIIRDYNDHERIANYINTNPSRWEEDMFNE